MLWQLIKAAFELLFITKHVGSKWDSELKLGGKRRSSPKYNLGVYYCIHQALPNKWDSSWLCHWVVRDGGAAREVLGKLYQLWEHFCVLE